MTGRNRCETCRSQLNWAYFRCQVQVSDRGRAWSLIGWYWHAIRSQCSNSQVIQISFKYMFWILCKCVLPLSKLEKWYKHQMLSFDRFWRHQTYVQAADSTARQQCKQRPYFTTVKTSFRVNTRQSPVAHGYSRPSTHIWHGNDVQTQCLNIRILSL